MNIGIIGYGKMGKLIESIALQSGHTIQVIIDPKKNHCEISKDTMKNVDVCIDFSHPNAALENIDKITALHIPLVMGTTGWYERLESIKTLVISRQSSLLYSPNFSIGVNLFLKIVEEATGLIDHFDEYDVGGCEIHHRQKADSPSGTAAAIVDILLKGSTRKTTVNYSSFSHPPKPEELHFSSLRTGFNPGMHSVIFDSPVDTITLTHQARSREGFAKGAVQAAEWLKGKTGFFTMNDFIQSVNL